MGDVPRNAVSKLELIPAGFLLTLRAGTGKSASQVEGQGSRPNLGVLFGE